jgi:hypothetical protein
MPLTQSRLLITGTTHPLPFDKLSPRDFERLCLWLVEREGYERAEHLGAAGSEQGRDIVAWRGGAQWAFQCKRVQRFGPKDALAEVEKVLALPEAERPTGLVFLVTRDVSVKTRKKVRAHCAGEMECDFWAGAELDVRVKRHPDIVKEFFQVANRREVEQREKTPTERLAEIWAKIRVDSPSKLLVILLGVLLLFTGIQAWVFYPPMIPTPVKTDSAVGVSYAVKYPRWIAVGDVEEFTITLINSGSEVLTEVNAFLVFTDTLHVSTDVKCSNKADFGELAINERKTRSIKFLLEKAEAEISLEAELRVVSKELGEKLLDTHTFSPLPIRNYKSIFRKLVAFVLLAVSSIGAFIGKEALKTL